MKTNLLNKIQDVLQENGEDYSNAEFFFVTNKEIKKISKNTFEQAVKLCDISVFWSWNDDDYSSLETAVTFGMPEKSVWIVGKDEEGSRYYEKMYPAIDCWNAVLAIEPDCMEFDGGYSDATIEEVGKFFKSADAMADCLEDEREEELAFHDPSYFDKKELEECRNIFDVAQSVIYSCYGIMSDDNLYWEDVENVILDCNEQSFFISPPIFKEIGSSFPYSFKYDEEQTLVRHVQQRSFFEETSPLFQKEKGQICFQTADETVAGFSADWNCDENKYFKFKNPVRLSDEEARDKLVEFFSLPCEFIEYEEEYSMYNDPDYSYEELYNDGWN